MTSNFFLIGRLTKDIEVENRGDKQISIITIAVTRAYKNADGCYDTDFISVVLFDGLATNTAEYCRKGDLVGVKGKIQSNSYETEDGIKYYGIDLIADKISFLSSKKSDE